MFRLVNRYALLLLPAAVSADPLSEIERVTVTGDQPYYHQTLQRVLPQSRLDPAELVTPAQISDLLVQSPAISLNGQGGQLQVVSIRGFSRWRVQTLVQGVPIVSDRRAGSGADFLPADFVGSVYVVPGAASTYLGSGAIGGAVDFLLAEPAQQLNLGWGNNQHNLEFGYSGYLNDSDWKLNYRMGDNGQAADGTPLFDQYEQSSLFFRQRWDGGYLREAWTLYSEGNNLGKSSSDYPGNRVTLYPVNDHWLGKFRFTLNGMEATAWWHQSRLDTVIDRPQKRINSSRNDATDYGLTLADKGSIQQWQSNWRLELNGRSGVEISEQELTPQQQLVYSLQSLDARETTIAGVFDISRQFDATSVALGGRLNWLQQQNLDTRIDDTDVSGFAGISQSLSASWQASLYLSSAFRNPSLTERFFNGETPRGRVTGDPDLATEQAWNLQGTLQYQSEQLNTSIELFTQRIDNYIERLEVAEDTLRYQNLQQAQISGISYQLDWQTELPGVSLSFNGQWLEGEDQDGAPVADIPADKHGAQVEYQYGDWYFFANLSYRDDKRRFADGEQALESVAIVNLGGRWQVTRDLAVKVALNNLTDREYRTSADDKAPLAHGCELQVKLVLAL